MLKIVRDVVAAAPLFQPVMPRSGKPLSVRMTNCGDLGWLTDQEKGYRYVTTHPETGQRWPPMPDALLTIWNEFAGWPDLADWQDPDGQPVEPCRPEACLINWYGPKARLGLHVDRDEQTFAAPVVSISLGDDAWFRVGGLNRRDPTKRLRLGSGDIVVLAGPARLVHHGIDRIVAGTSDLLAEGGRFNLTLRRVTPVA